jgi:hypothetical protein
VTSRQLAKMPEILWQMPRHRVVATNDAVGGSGDDQSEAGLQIATSARMCGWAW